MLSKEMFFFTQDYSVGYLIYIIEDACNKKKKKFSFHSILTKWIKFFFETLICIQ